MKSGYNKATNKYNCLNEIFNLSYFFNGLMNPNSVMRFYVE